MHHCVGATFLRRFTPKKKAKNGAKNDLKKANENGADNDDDNDDKNDGANNDNDDADANNDANSLRKIVISTDIDTDEEIIKGSVGISEKNVGDVALTLDANRDYEEKKNKVDNSVQRQPSTGADRYIDKTKDVNEQRKATVASSNGLVRDKLVKM